VTRRGRVAKKYRPFVRSAELHGGTVKPGRSHLKVYDHQGLVTVIPYGRQQFEGRGDLAMLRKMWRERGWME